MFWIVHSINLLEKIQRSKLLISDKIQRNITLIKCMAFPYKEQTPLLYYGSYGFAAL